MVMMTENATDFDYFEIDVTKNDAHIGFSRTGTLNWDKLDWRVTLGGFGGYTSMILKKGVSGYDDLAIVGHGYSDWISMRSQMTVKVSDGEITVLRENKKSFMTAKDDSITKSDLKYMTVWNWSSETWKINAFPAGIINYQK